MSATNSSTIPSNISWSFAEDSSFQITNNLKDVVYHPSLNVLLVFTHENQILVYDATSGSVYKQINSIGSKEGLKCCYLPTLERLVATSNDVLSTRKDHNGVLLLDNLLQLQVQTPEDYVTAVLSLNDAIHLIEASVCSDSVGMDNTAELWKDLEQEVIRVKEATKSNHKEAKWATVCLRQPHGVLLKALHSILADMHRIRMDLPGLSVISSLVDQVSLFSVNSELDTPGVIDKGLMHNECVRRSTFKDWPHLDYKWALPVPMAQAGFYYNPYNKGDDRAMCFVCNTCLVCWEATDEPWSEHERHSSHCPFVKGEYTQNVPISATHATEPAKLHSSGDEITSIGSTTSERFFATVMSNSYVVVWDTHTFLKGYAVIHVYPSNPVICKALKSRLSNNFDDTKVGEENQMASTVNLGSACIISQPLEINSETLRPGNSRNFLVVGARLSFQFEQEVSKDSSMTEMGLADNKSTDVMVQNRLNQEKNGECAISAAEFGGICAKEMPSETRLVKSATVICLCLLVYDVTVETCKDSTKDSVAATSASSSFKQKQTNFNPKKPIGKSYSPHQDLMSDMHMVEDILDDDQDIQIVDFKLPLNCDMEEVSSKPKPKIILTSNSGQVASYDSCPPVMASAGNAAQNLQESLQCQAALCIPLPEEIKSSRQLTIKHILPTQDGSRLFVVVGLENEDVANVESDEILSWTLIYKVVYYKSGPLLESTPLAINSYKEIITSACLIPTDACQLLMYNDEDSSSDDNLLVVNVKGETLKGQTISKKSADDESLKWENADNDLQDYQLSVKKMFGSALLVTSGGDVDLLSLTDLSLMASLKGSSLNHKDPFVSATYCSGIDRICLGTQSNQLKFFFLKPAGDQNCQEFPSMDGSMLAADTSFDSVDGSPNQSLGAIPKNSDQASPSQLLTAQKKLTANVLIDLRRLIYYKNLTPRFVSTVPPYWKEVVQEQQQRKHPQHLHHHGEGVQHTRSWKLQTDSTAINEENLFELVLPLPTIIGHVLLRFSLNHSILHASPPPQIRVTLLRQKPSSKPGQRHELDEHIDFGLTHENKRDGSFSKDQYIENLEKRYKAKVVYGPIDLADHVDLSGSHGIIPMSSKLLMRDWSKTLLLHFKVINLAKVDSHGIFPPNQSQEPIQGSVKKQEAAKANEKQWDSVVTGKPPPGPSSSAILGQRFKVNESPLNVQGNVMMQEISITIRKFRKFGTSHKDQASKLSLNLSSLENRMAHLRRLNRCYMLENPSFHERLLEIIASQEKLLSVGSIKSVKLHLALDILIWIINVTRDDCCTERNSSHEKVDILKLMQGCLTDILKTCLLCSDRSLAHKCARMFAACFISCNHSAQLGDSDMAIQFQTSLLTSLINCLPLITTTSSAGAIHWFFVLLNHVKHLNPNLASVCCGELLTKVAEEYALRNDELHSFLRTKLGLCGSPLDPELFDLDPSLPSFTKGFQTKTHHSQPSVTVPVSNSYAGVVMGQSSYLYGSVLGSAPGTSGSMTVPGPPAGLLNPPVPEETTFKDLMYLLDLERNFGTSIGDITLKNEQNARFMTGLLEAEPLHFTCHSASDGTRLEELDAASQAMITSAMQPSSMVGPSDAFGGPFNFTPDTMMVFDAATGAQVNIKGGHFGGLSGSMGSSMGASMDDSQLQQLHNKQMMLLKLQMQKKKLEQKLAETTKAMAGGSSKQSTNTNLLSSEFPPAPKNTPFFMTPPLTPSEIYPNLFSSSALPDSPKNADGSKLEGGGEEASGGTSSQKASFSWQQTKNIFQTPTPYALVIDRLHSGARRFIVLDFGKPICLTDLVFPACSDVASMSIDVWLNSEQTDGQRLVESNDIWSNNLIMCDILPPPICRYLKVTIIRRYGGNAGRPKIPIGSFYGHTFVIPWQRVSDVSLTSILSTTLHVNLAQQSEAVMTPSERNQAVAQLNICMSLLEDIQCSYGMARSRLSSLASSLVQGQSADHASRLMLLPKGKYTAAEEKVVQAYHKTIQLQIQLNLAKRAVYRLQQELGFSTHQPAEEAVFDLRNTTRLKSILISLNTDTLRFLAEQLSAVLLGLSAGIPPSINVSSGIFQSPFVEGLFHAESFFSSLCVLSPSRKLQTTAGVLLARVCGDLPWWGDFFGRIFFEFFSADQKHIFPQDRLFILLVYLGQKSLCSSSAGQVLESILSLLSKTLLPLYSSSGESQIENLDLTLISWLLLFVSKSLDSVSSATYLEEGDKQAVPNSNGKTKEVGSKWPGSTPYLNNRWNFLQAEDVLSQSESTGNVLQPVKPLKGGGSLKCSNRRRIYARIVQQKLNYPLKFVHQKKHLWKNDIVSGYHFGKPSNGVAPESMKKTKLSAFFKAMISVKGAKVMPSKSSFSLVDSEDENPTALNSSLGNNNSISDFSGPGGAKPNHKSGGFKKLLGGTGKKEGASAIIVDGWDLQEWDPVSLVSRSTCLNLVRGLYNLILSLDLTCHVDLFIVACKVLTRIMTSSKPTIQLSEVMTMQDVEKLLILACGGEYNSGQKLWGGAWTSHIIICFLQDILEAERLGQHQLDANNSNDCQASSSTNGASQLAFNSSVQNAMHCDTSDEEDDDDDDITLANNSAVPDLMADCKFDEEMSMLVDALVHDEEVSNPLKAGIEEALSEEQVDSAKQDWFDMKSLYAATEGLDAYGFWNYISDKEGKLSKADWKDIDSFDSNDNLNESATTWKFPSNALPPPILSQELPLLHYQQKHHQASNNSNNKFSNNNNASMSFSKSTFQSKLPVPFFGVSLSNASKSSQSSSMFHQFHYQPFKTLPPTDYSMSQAVSLATDLRLEQGLELTAELKLKTMLALENNVMQSCLLQPLHSSPPEMKKQPVAREGHVRNLLDPCQMCPSMDMLSVSFSNLFKNLSTNRINLEDLLDLWLTLNDSLPTITTSELEPLLEGVGSNFVPIDNEAVGSLLQYVSQSTSLNDRTWTLLFKCLTQVEAFREYFSKNFNSENMESNLLQDPNFSIILQKFLSGSSRSRYPGSMDCKVGPLLVNAFHEFVRSPSLNQSRQKGKLQDILLSIISNFSAQGGSFYSCNGPLDAQTVLVDSLADMVDSIRAEPVRVTLDDMSASNDNAEREDGCLDLQVCLQVIANVSSLVLLHMSSIEPVLCQSSSEAFFINPRICFTGLYQMALKNGDNKNSSSSRFTSSCRDSLILSLLKLLDQLLRLPLPPAYPTSNYRSSMSEHYQLSEKQMLSDSVVEFMELTAMARPDVPNVETVALGGQSSCFNPEAGITDEQKASANQHSLSEPLPQSSGSGQTSFACHTCSHRNFFDLIGGSKGNEMHGMFGRSKMVADVVLSKLDIMFNLYSSLSLCSRDVLAPFKKDETYNGENPFSVGDGVFKVLCTLNAKATGIELVVEPLYKFLAGTVGSPAQLSSTMTSECRSLSEPLLLFTMKVLDCFPALVVFAELGGIEMVCTNLVKSNEQAISIEPSLISTMMQYFGNSKVLNSGGLRIFWDRNSDGLQNFAPIGTISSSSQVASPSSVLIQNTPPPRRARSAAWSYHFYPEEKWVDLTVTLPFAILLKEVIIVPHFSSLDTCPSAIIIESSRDGYSPSLPLCSPICTSGLTSIRVKLPSPKISTVVTIRFHKPQDSTILGLTQIMLMGTLALGPDVKIPSESLKSYASRNAEDNVLKPNSEWLRLFHHCLMKGDNEPFHSRVILAASSVPNFLKVCVSLLLISPLPEVEKVLLLVGRQTVEASLQLIDIILGGCGMTLDYMDDNKEEVSGTDGKTSGSDHESYTGILYNLCTFQDAASLTRVSALLEWLSKCAKWAIERRQNFTESVRDSAGQVVESYLQATNGPSVKNILCISAILWEMKKKCNLKDAINRDFVGLMYNWSCSYSAKNSLKEAIDNVVCAACYVRPDLFPYLVEHMDLFSQQTDDSKSTLDGNYNSFFSDDAPVTDDIKADHRGVPDRRQSPLIGRLSLSSWKLSTLATVSRAPKSLKYLEKIGFFSAVCKLLYDFFKKDPGRKTSPRTSSSWNGNPLKSPPPGDRINVGLVTALLDFLAEVSQEGYVKDLLNDPQNRSFWSPLLGSLCSRPSAVFPENVHLHKWNLPILESCAIKFITNLISCHGPNQQEFSRTLYDTIKTTALPTSSFSSPLPGFLRRLLLQVILEDEKMVVYIHSKDLPLSKESSTHGHLTHPCFGAGHYHRTRVTSIQSALADVVNSLSSYESATLSQLLGTEPSKEVKAGNGKKSPAGHTSTQHQSKISAEKSLAASSSPGAGITVALYHSIMPDQPLPGELTLPQLQTILSDLGALSSSCFIELDLRQWKSGLCQTQKECQSGQAQALLKTQCNSSLLQIFSGIGGLALLAERLPLLCPEFVRQTSNLTDNSSSSKGHQVSPMKTYQSGFMPVDWTTMEVNEEIYEDPDETPMSPPYSQSKPATQSSSLQLQSNPSIPPHSLIAFGIFLRLPGYSEVLLKERKKAQYLLRLVLGVTDDGNGGLILNSSVAGSLPSLPFQVLKRLLDSSPLTTDDGMLLRRMCVDIGVLHLILACLSILGHHAPRQHIPGLYQEILKVASQSQLYMSNAGSTSSGTSNVQIKSSEEKGQNYWAKGTGFGTGSTASSWDAEHALLRQKSEEEHVTCLMQVLASFINPKQQDASAIDKSSASSDASFGSASSFAPSIHKTQNQTIQAGPSFSGSTSGSALPSCLPVLLSQSCLLPALSSYLRNDSVLDMACHVPLYRALLELLQAIATCPPLVSLLLPLPEDDGSTTSSSSSSAISALLDKMKKCVDTYANRLKSNKARPKEMTDDESEGLAPLIREIQDTSAIVNYAVAEHLSASGLSLQKEKKKDMPSSSSPLSSSGAGVGEDGRTLDEKYISVMKLLQYDTYKMVVEEQNSIKLAVPHYYEANVRAAGEVNNPLRARRLAQEAVTLSTSLPLSSDSSVFVRCDEDRLDVMKVLMIGPTGTPYSQGCFEFDVFFPTDYPNSPPLINLQTTGNHSIRFNPNLYNDGKVCLSIINTWHGRPEEKWNSQTSSFLQVLVSVQSLILVGEPYFNEPGYERSRGTPSGMASSREYDSNIRQATVKWAMLEMIKNPPPAFKQIVQWHFWLKKDEILSQVEEWMNDMESHTKDKRVGRNITQNLLSLKRHYAQLKEEFSKLPVPENIDSWQEEEEEEEVQNEDDDDDDDEGISFSASSKAENSAL